MVLDICFERSGAFDIVLAQLQPGARIVYHKGMFCSGAHRVAAYNAACERRVLLVQRRIDGGMFQYIAVVRGFS